MQESMKENKVWDLVDLPPVRNGFLRLNADLLKGIRLALWLRVGIDYEDTFPPVLRLVSIRLILDILAHMDLELDQTSFLNGDLDEEIYMDRVALMDRSPKYASSKEKSMGALRFHRARMGLR